MSSHAGSFDSSAPFASRRRSRGAGRIVLENESLPADSATMHYVIVPQLLALLGLHVSIWRRQEPWLG